jgi:hypothetical protein
VEQAVGLGNFDFQEIVGAACQIGAEVFSHVDCLGICLD